MMKKNDYILIGIILLVAGVLFLLFGRNLNKDAGVVQITVDGKVRGEYRLSSDQEIDIDGTNKLIIKDGKADMVWADCPDKVCVNQNPISKNGESLVCLPNKVMVTVESDDGNEVDAIVK